MAESRTCIVIVATTREQHNSNKHDLTVWQAVVAGRRYKPVKFAVVMSGNDTSTLDRSAWLEAYCMAGTQGAPLAGPSIQLPAGMVRSLQIGDEAQAAGGSGTPAATQPTR